ncbi:hypothetical protein JCM10213v2_002774 [Rhodosporidiobolus nylandii]
MVASAKSSDTPLGRYLASAGGSFHPALYGKQDSYGTSVYTSEPLSSGCKVVCCPFSLAATPTLARQSIPDPLFPSSPPSSQRKNRQPNHELMALYLCLHLLPPETVQRVTGLDLQHNVYVDSLPRSPTMRTPLYFSAAERELLRGSNLYGATEDRERGWKEEWEEVRSWVTDEQVREELSWERWLWACTIISSRAFPSHLIDGDKDNSTPVLFPGIDLLNHRPQAKVTWSSDVHVETLEEQIHNTYGAKSNEELLLGYGFVLPSNPADFVALKLSLPPNCSPTLFDLIHTLKLDNLRHFVPRSGELPRELLAQMRLLVASGEEVAEVDAASQDGKGWDEAVGFISWENELDVLDTLEGMLHGKLAALVNAGEPEGEVREDVREMVEIYRQGQIDILQAAVAYREKVFEETIARAEEAGVELAFEDEEMDDMEEEDEE